MFGGYRTFRDLPALMRWTRRTAFTPRGWRVAAAKMMSAVLRGRQGSLPSQSRWAKLPEMVRRGDDLLALYQLAYALFLPGFQQDLLGDASLSTLTDGLPRPLHRRLAAEIDGRSALSALSVLESRLFLAERLLRDNDVASMAASVEQRLPLVDSVVFETVDRVGDQARYQPLGRKDLLRRAGLRGLDPALFERPKWGFVLPFDRWIRHGLGREMSDTLRDAEAVRRSGLRPASVERIWRAYQDGGPRPYWSRVWALFVHIRWCQRHQVSM